MNNPAASGQGILLNRYFKRRGNPRGIKPTGGININEVFFFLLIPVQYSI
jgi:hypothetical protein